MSVGNGDSRGCEKRLRLESITSKGLRYFDTGRLFLCADTKEPRSSY